MPERRSRAFDLAFGSCPRPSSAGGTTSDDADLRALADLFVGAEPVRLAVDYLIRPCPCGRDPGVGDSPDLEIQRGDYHRSTRAAHVFLGPIFQIARLLLGDNEDARDARLLATDVIEVDVHEVLHHALEAEGLSDDEQHAPIKAALAWTLGGCDV